MKKQGKSIPTNLVMESRKKSRGEVESGIDFSRDKMEMRFDIDKHFIPFSNLIFLKSFVDTSRYENICKIFIKNFFYLIRKGDMYI